MQVSAEELFHDEIVEELHVRCSEPDGGVDTVMQRSCSFQIFERVGKAAAQFLRDILKDFPKVTVFELEHVDVHQQPKVMMIVHHLLD